MTPLNETVYNLAAINKRMNRKPKKTDLYLFARGLCIALDEKHIKEIESIIATDYKRAMEYISQAKKQLSK